MDQIYANFKMLFLLDQGSNLIRMADLGKYDRPAVVRTESQSCMVKRFGPKQKGQ